MKAKVSLPFANGTIELEGTLEEIEQSSDTLNSFFDKMSTAFGEFQKTPMTVTQPIQVQPAIGAAQVGAEAIDSVTIPVDTKKNLREAIVYVLQHSPKKGLGTTDIIQVLETNMIYKSYGIIAATLSQLQAGNRVQRKKSEDGKWVYFPSLGQ